jgi:hypothetical protein
MNAKPVLVVHGIAAHDQAGFELRVTRLRQTMQPQLHDVRRTPVFWGDLGAHSDDLTDCLPHLDEKGRWAIRPAELLNLQPTDRDVRSQPKRSNAMRAALIAESISDAPSVRGEPDELSDAVM